MKLLLNILCWILTAYCICFPKIYFRNPINTKEVRLSQILVNTQQEAEKVKKEIQEGKSFKNAVLEYSLCDSKENNGDLGNSARGILLPDIENVAFNKLKLNEISDPIQTENGWHIVKVTQIKHYSDKESFGERY